MSGTDTLVSSVVGEVSIQADGRQRVTEVHTDAEGERYFITYLAPITHDIEAALQDHADQLNADLADPPGKRFAQ